MMLQAQSHTAGQADEKAFAMPVRVGLKEHWEMIHPTTEWQTMKTPLTPRTVRPSRPTFTTSTSAKCSVVV